MIVSTPIDDLMDLLLKEKNKTLSLNVLAKKLGIEREMAESWLRVLQDEGYVKIDYPLIFIQKPTVKAVKSYEPPMERIIKQEKNKLEEYEIIANNVKAHINIWDVKNETMPYYEIIIPRVNPPTHVFMEDIVDKLTRMVALTETDITDPRRLLEVEQKFLNKANEALTNLIPTIQKTTKDVLSGMLLHRVFGLGDLEFLIADDWLEEIGINSSISPISVYHRKYRWMKTNMFLADEKEVYNFASQIGRKVGKDITNLSPLMDAHLITGDRVNASLFPISSPGNTITFRKFARNPWTIIHFISPEVHTVSPEIAALLWECIQYELNIMVAGGTASGKTSLLNAVCAFMPSNHRILSIEDTRELRLPRYLTWNWISLSTRTPNPEGKGGVSMLDLLVSALRMRPDRVIVGEVRRKKEAVVLFEAMHTGHSVYSTMHADRAEQAKERLTQPPIDIPPTEISALHLISTQYRDRRTGRRRCLELAEVIPAEEGEEVGINILYRWIPRTDEYRKMSESIRIYPEINLHTGMSRREMAEDLKTKEDILKWMLDKKWDNVDKVGEIMRIFYKEPDRVIKAAEENHEPSRLLS